MFREIFEGSVGRLSKFMKCFEVAGAFMYTGVIIMSMNLFININLYGINNLNSIIKL
jgi:hypothetical protein